jgi:imidazolonepropionase-like amidohydrolase
MKRTLSALFCLTACTHSPESAPKKNMPAPLQKGIVVVGGKLRFSDGTTSTKNIRVSQTGKITAIDDAPAAEGDTVIDVKGAFLVPAFIDSHVHMTFSEPIFALQGGIGAAIDLGAPVRIWDEAPRMLPLRLYPVGQLLTAVGGYPTQGWGSDGYGREIRGVEDAKAAVQEVIKRGAKMVKMPLESSGPLLTAEEQKVIVDAAHAAGLPVGSHALYERVVQMGFDAGVDVLVHAPVEKLSDGLIQKFCQRPKAAVVTTFQAFGGDLAIDNVKRMKAAGCKILYGSDLGNGVSAGILMGELDDMKKAGMTPAEIIDAATKTPAQYFGLSDLGELSVGKNASFLVVEGDPYQDISTLENRKVFIDGVEIK